MLNAQTRMNIYFFAINPVLKDIVIQRNNVNLKLIDVIKSNNEIIGESIFSRPIQTYYSSPYDRFVFKVTKAKLTGLDAPLNINVSPNYVGSPQERIVKDDLI